MYAQIDQLVLTAITQGKSPLYAKEVIEESMKIAKTTGREPFRVIDGRLQALRKAKKIRYVRETGWILCTVSS